MKAYHCGEDKTKDLAELTRCLSLKYASLYAFDIQKEKGDLIFNVIHDGER